MKIHFIAIGGSIMHALAINLKSQGHEISGSDDAIYDPARTNLKNAGILPNKEGWFLENINEDLDFIILGMHAKIDNPELEVAKRKKIRIYSFPEFIAKNSKDKFKVVITGSHGKTSITSMIMYALKKNNILFDYLVGAKIKGFDNMVSLSDNKIIIIEGDEYFSSKLDMTPKFMYYEPNILVVSGISWDHINVYPTFSSYCNVFKNLIKNTPKKSSIFYYNNDSILKNIIDENSLDAQAYSLPSYKVCKGKFIIVHENIEFPLKIFGKHNLCNLQVASLVCDKLGLKKNLFFKSIVSFEGAAKRLTFLGNITETNNVYLDFAHSPSKVLATTQAVKELFPNRVLVSCLELHSFSSLNFDFISEYSNSFIYSDVVYIYFSSKELKRKNLDLFKTSDVLNKINHNNVIVFDNSYDLFNALSNSNWENSNLLLMSSGNFGGLNLDNLFQ
ncbi:MAG: hypothetical protein CBC73_02710 [Flavobacteriales bacterium TMED113]|nr:MAG: hypothetical protein CBC73_02710 [Flavobacteriales bacterium TMED113]